MDTSYLGCHNPDGITGNMNCGDDSALIEKQEVAMLYVKLTKVVVAKMTADRATEQDIVLRCVDEDHQYHLFKEIVACYDNHPDWRCQTVSNGFRDYRHREHEELHLAVVSGNDSNPHWEPSL